MVEISVKVPDDLPEEIRRFPIDVSRVVVEAIRNEVVKVAALKTIAAKSKLTEEDALALGKKLKKGRGAELQKRGLI